MKKFLLKIFLLLAVCALSMALLSALAFFVAAPQHQELYTGAIADKIQRLESLESPKIILAGDSNLAFGMDSARLEEAFDMPVVNLGGHGGLGNGFHLNMAKRNIQAGDIVVISTTGYASTGVLDPALAWITIEGNTDYLSLVPSGDGFKMLKALPKYVLKTLFYWVTGTGNQTPDDAYARSAFNPYGDNVFPRTETTFYFHPDSVNTPVISPEGMQVINEFAAYCADRGATCLIAAAPIACQPDVVDVQAFVDFEQELRQAAACDVISHYPDYLYDHTLFSDTASHMTQEGVALRTQQLIKDLSVWMENDSAPLN